MGRAARCWGGSKPICRIELASHFGRSSGLKRARTNFWTAVDRRGNFCQSLRRVQVRSRIGRDETQAVHGIAGCFWQDVATAVVSRTPQARNAVVETHEQIELPGAVAVARVFERPNIQVITKG